MNVIFDLGGVLYSWNPIEIAESILKETAVARRVATEFCGGPEWNALDQGIISEEDAIVRAAGRTGIPQVPLQKFMSSFFEGLVPISETVEILRLCKKQNINLTVLSNMHHKSANFLEEHDDILGLFSEIVFSCRVKMKKPDNDIFLHTTAILGSPAEDCLFIDDTLENILAAENLGFSTIHFTSPEKLREELFARGILIKESVWIN